MLELAVISQTLLAFAGIYFWGIVSVGDCELKTQRQTSIVLNILILNKNLNSAVPAAVYDIFERTDNNMWAQKVINFVTLT